MRYLKARADVRLQHRLIINTKIIGLAKLLLTHSVTEPNDCTVKFQPWDDSLRLVMSHFFLVIFVLVVSNMDGVFSVIYLHHTAVSSPSRHD